MDLAVLFFVDGVCDRRLFRPQERHGGIEQSIRTVFSQSYNGYLYCQEQYKKPCNREHGRRQKKGFNI